MSNQKHIPYHSIDNLNRKNIDAIPSGAPCQVFQKIHGSNFGIHCFANGDIRFASRNKWLSPESSFYGFQTVITDEYLERIKEAIRDILEKRGIDYERIIIFGELFGGSLPGYPKIKGISRVQKDILYAPDIHFWIFDIKIDDSYCDYNDYYQVLDRFKLPYCPAIFEGSFEECLKYPIEDVITDIPEKLGYEYICNDKEKKNIWEGVVVKPTTETFFKGHRFLVKRKTENFTDRCKTKEVVEIGNEKQKELVEEIIKYVNKNCFWGMLSKMGIDEEAASKCRNKVAGAIVKDAIENWQSDTGKELPEHKKERRVIISALNTAAFKIIQEELTVKV